MYEQKVTLTNEIGLHARPASIFIRAAVKFPCDITVEKNGRSYNAKSIMSVLSMSASNGDELTLKAEGDKEEEAIKSLVEVIESKINNQ
ncbi:HPr family phosphocarrier protein [Anaerococcus sp. mt242]|uniref:HPr family phosphocarrier protein n=1 Tax=unclassified Anaerococcus TaxID=2614126 RepID=UPI001933717C|nr:HPr family phosphocarrier protein [Anaerococcus sp. mt242]MBM0046748.1 HPr family phosphocarrier protein [Anaerococcus sp. mt242]